MKKQTASTILKETREIYNRIAPDFSDTRGKWWPGFGSFNKYAKPGDSILDVGCGNGRMADIFDGAGVEYLGIDSSEELIKIARERFKNKPWVRFQVGDASGLLNGSYNMVLMIAVLHHIPTKELRKKILKNVFNALEPGGYFVISTWNLWQAKDKFRYWKYLFNYVEKIKHGVYNINDAFVPWKRDGSNVKLNLRYVHSFTKKELGSLLRDAGFKISWIKYESKDGETANIFSGANLMAVAIKK